MVVVEKQRLRNEHMVVVVELKGLDKEGGEQQEQLQKKQQPIVTPPPPAPSPPPAPG